MIWPEGLSSLFEVVSEVELKFVNFRIRLFLSQQNALACYNGIFKLI